MDVTRKFQKAKYLLEFRDFVAEISSAEVSKLWDILTVRKVFVDLKQEVKWKIVLVRKVTIGSLQHLLIFKQPGQMVIGYSQSEYSKPVVGQLTKVLLHMTPEIQTETIELFHEPKRNQGITQREKECILKTRYIVEVETQYYGPKRKLRTHCA